MSYRPICDYWLLARPKVKYYGVYPNGFLERARALLGVQGGTAIVHVCGGHAKDYPNWAKLCPHDKTLDLDPACSPDFLQDVAAPLPGEGDEWAGWPALLGDSPYSLLDSDRYTPGRRVFPSAGLVLRQMLAAVRPGGRVGLLHVKAPRPPEGVKFVASVAVLVGFDNQLRQYSVYEKLVRKDGV